MNAYLEPFQIMQLAPIIVNDYNLLNCEQ